MNPGGQLGEGNERAMSEKTEAQRTGQLILFLIALAMLVLAPVFALAKVEAGFISLMSGGFLMVLVASMND